MRTFVLFVAVACPFTAICQSNVSADQKHVLAFVPEGARGFQLSALNIERGTGYPSVVHLQGNSEVRAPVCLPVGKKRAMVCDGYMILHADTVEFHEATGQIEAHGNVSVIPLWHGGGKK